VNNLTEPLDRIERCYDAIPRASGARVEHIGPFALFVTEGPGWPFYARPQLDARDFTPASVATVRARQRELGVPEAFEWVDDLAPTLRPAAEEAGLKVLLAPLMLLDPSRLPVPADLSPVPVRLLDPDAPDFADLHAVSSAVARLGFGAPTTAVGGAGPVQRDAAISVTDPQQLERFAAATRAGTKAQAVAVDPEHGVLATGAYQSAGDVAEIVGVATLPSARRRGLGAAVSSALARHALDVGMDLVFLSAADADVARVYARIGFDRIGTACIASPSDPTT
jgi:GNAT superfamily N-acetyltransferase